MHPISNPSQGKVGRNWRSSDIDSKCDTTMRPTIILSLICLFALAASAQSPSPKFNDYPARVNRSQSSVKVKLNSTPDTSCFRTMLRQTAEARRQVRRSLRHRLLGLRH